jgi:hypothetical protein
MLPVQRRRRGRHRGWHCSRDVASGGDELGRRQTRVHHIHGGQQDVNAAFLLLGLEGLKAQVVAAEAAAVGQVVVALVHGAGHLGPAVQVAHDALCQHERVLEVYGEAPIWRRPDVEFVITRLLRSEAFHHTKDNDVLRLKHVANTIWAHCRVFPGQQPHA